MQPKAKVDGCKAHLKDLSPMAAGTETTSRSSTLESESFYESGIFSGVNPSTWKKIRRLSAGSKLSTYYYIGAELRVCASSNRKTSSRPVLRDVIDRRTGTSKVLKIISKSRLPGAPDGLTHWRALCEKLLNFKPSPGIMRIEQVWESDSSFYIITEKLGGGELFEFLLKEKVIPEDVCKYIMKQIFQAVALLHNEQMLHRDIKPENIMFRNPTNSTLSAAERYELVLIDFDTCKMTDADNADNTDIVNGKRRLVGTYGYLAPEILRGEEYSTASDMWSIGVVLYILMTGVPPITMDKMYDAKSSHAVLTAAETTGIDFNMPPLAEFPLARDLCRRLLCFDRTKRITSATDALAHPWLVGLANAFDRSLNLNSYPMTDHRDRRQDAEENSSGGYIRSLFGSRNAKTAGNGNNTTSSYKRSDGRNMPYLQCSHDTNIEEGRATKRPRTMAQMPQRQFCVSPRNAALIAPTTPGAVRC
ncbi:protein kinase domain containing protein [Babesia bovis T2Bo]|uniref:protein kinase domain containing protein n=1 Tax=Babesia bovis T2Bo TaxID=484906 RepID=UPI001C354DF8|nr:protein kinase domain containing protein [Babesia bovis T2Bo]EDO08316.2 protein kinase domain containing protein [Babesia bovis T2Bo]